MESFFKEDTAPPVLWHYTSAQGLLGILKDGEIFASDSRFLNDKTENVRIWTLIRQRLKERVKLGNDDEFVKIVDEVAELMSAQKDKPFGDSVPALLVELQSLLAVHKEEDVFVSCFSAEEDSLSQWRAYTSGNGYAIGFSSEVLSGLTDNSLLSGLPLCRFDSVKYVADEHRTALDGVINTMLANQLGEKRAGKPWPDERAASSFERFLLDRFSPFVKDDGFKGEKEWRLALKVGTFDPSKIEFRPGRSHLIPFLRVSLEKDHPNYIREIMVGPGPSSELDLLALQRLVKSRGLPIEVRNSKIPFRNW